MNIKTHAKINVWMTQIIYACIVRIAVVFSLIMYPIVIFLNPPAETFWFLISCIFYLVFSGGILNFINKHFNIIQKFLNISNNQKFILSILLTRTHSSMQLNSELDKLAKAIKNQSTIYKELNKTDFPFLNKLFSRLEQINKKKSNSFNTLDNNSTKDET